MHGSKFMSQLFAIAKMPSNSKRKQRNQQYKRKKGAGSGQFKGRKERLRAKNLELEKKVEHELEEKCKLEERKTELDYENTILKRLAIAVFQYTDGMVASYVAHAFK